MNFNSATHVKDGAFFSKMRFNELYPRDHPAVTPELFGGRRQSEEMMDGKDAMEGEPRSGSTLGNALEEARARFARIPEPAHLAATGQERAGGRATRRRGGSLLDYAPPFRDVAADKTERARMAMQAIAARRALTGAGLRRNEELEDMLENVRVALDECRTAVRECREVMRNLVSKRDRNYF